MWRGVIVGLVLLLLGGCEGVREQLGLNKQAPDEFTVLRKAPLVLPPDFSLRPPAPGTTRPQEETPTVAARRALTEGGREVSASDLDDVAEDTRAEAALLQKAGAEKPDPDIRATVNREATALAEESDRFVDRLIFWQQRQLPGTVVDAREERKRLRENAAVGAPVTKGETPSIKKRQRAIFEGIF